MAYDTASTVEKREHICPFCCWHDGEGFCNHPRYWNYEVSDKSCRSIVGCRYFVEVEESE